DMTHWSPWYLDGRSAMFGWCPKAGDERPTFAALRLDPVARAFGKKAERLAPFSVTQIPAVMGWEEEIIHGVGISPAGADEALAWADYSLVLQQQQQAVDSLTSALMSSSPTGMPLHRLTTLVTAQIRPTARTEDMAAAIPFLALRAARRAIAADPDHPDGYYALAFALRDPNLPLPQDERVVAQANALRQFLSRLPPPERYKRGAYL